MRLPVFIQLPVARIKSAGLHLFRPPIEERICVCRFNYLLAKRKKIELRRGDVWESELECIERLKRETKNSSVCARVFSERKNEHLIFILFLLFMEKLQVSA
jgi:hypothetical protein